MRFALRVDNLSKKYLIGAEQEATRTLRDALGRWLSLPARRWRGRKTSEPRTVWALQDINLEVEQGSTLGIIGANGSGKSTLLKILSRITPPTTGRVEIRGRVSSLLEVGTGFHPELTGRDNIYLNGAILGMRKFEIDRCFDEIVAFAEIDRYLDSPVKWYSSGMYMRLAFAVAAHLQPEILFVDEVLAVGDVAFQKKCLGKMDDIAGKGRTVVFVSHNMAAVKQLCSRVLLLERGRMRMVETDVQNVISRYLSLADEDANDRGWCVWQDGAANDEVRDLKILGVCLRDAADKIASSFDTSEPITVDIAYRVEKPLSNCRLGFYLSRNDDVLALDTHDVDFGGLPADKSVGDFVARCRVPGGLLCPGRYFLSINAGIAGHRNLAHLEYVLGLTIRGVSDLSPNEGVILPRFRWSVTGQNACAGWLKQLEDTASHRAGQAAA